jgi:L-arabinose isomerase
MRKSRVGIIGEPFRGMGDFAVPFDVLKKEIGLEVVSASSEDIAKLMPELDSEPVKAETAKDIKRFKQGEFTAEALAESESACLAVGKWLEAKKLNAFTMNFQNITGAPGLPVVPFLEASKAMARGIGYGGEGDVLTAALCGALAQVIPETTFTEMFCPDWQEERIFLSHMGEVNTDLAVDPELNQRPYPYSAAGEPVLASGCLKAGNGWLVNVAPGPDNTFSLITAPVEVCDSNGQEAIEKGIRGWIKPQIPLSDFLEKYSRLGGTHHKVLCYNADEATLKAFAARMGWSFHVIL